MQCSLVRSLVNDRESLYYRRETSFMKIFCCNFWELPENTWCIVVQWNDFYEIKHVNNLVLYTMIYGAAKQSLFCVNNIYDLVWVFDVHSRHYFGLLVTLILHLSQPDQYLTFGYVFGDPLVKLTTGMNNTWRIPKILNETVESISPRSWNGCWDRGGSLEKECVVTLGIWTCCTFSLTKCIHFNMFGSMLHQVARYLHYHNKPVMRETADGGSFNG